MKTLNICGFFLIFATSLFAGRYAGDFMEIGAGVKPLGMGGAFTAVANNGDAIYWNASGLGQLTKPDVELMHAFLYDNLATYDNVSFAHPLPNNVTIGLNWTRLTVSDIPYFDESYLVGTNVDQRSLYPDLQLPGVTDQYFRSTDDLYQFAFAKAVHKDLDLGWFFFGVPVDFCFGGNVKYIKRELQDYIGTGTGFDVSMLGKLGLEPVIDIEGAGTLQFGINFKDLGGTTITWNTESDHTDEILQSTRMGLAYLQPLPRLHSTMVFAFDTEYEYDTVQHYGFEWQYRDRSFVRIGCYDKNFSAGAGFRFFNFQADYTFTTNVLGSTNRVGLSFTY